MNNEPLGLKIWNFSTPIPDFNDHPGFRSMQSVPRRFFVCLRKRKIFIRLERFGHPWWGRHHLDVRFWDCKRWRSRTKCLLTINFFLNHFQCPVIDFFCLRVRLRVRTNNFSGPNYPRNLLFSEKYCIFRKSTLSSLILYI